jgi:hypothetical protein
MTLFHADTQLLIDCLLVLLLELGYELFL